MWGICVLVAIVLLLIGLGIFFMYRPIGGQRDTEEVQRCDYKQTTRNDAPKSVSLIAGKTHSEKTNLFKRAQKHRQNPINTRRKPGLRHKNPQMRQHIYDIVNGTDHSEKLKKLESALSCLENSGLGFHGNPPDSRLNPYDDENDNDDDIFLRQL